MNEESTNQTPETGQPTSPIAATTADAPLSSTDAPAPPAAPSPVASIQNQALEASIIEALRTVYDPEIPVNIYDMGLIYNIAIDADNKVDIRMTLTSPMCPVAGSLPPEAANKVKTVEGVTDATVELVWDPPWTPDNMSEAAKLQLNM